MAHFGARAFVDGRISGVAGSRGVGPFRRPAGRRSLEAPHATAVLDAHDALLLQRLERRRHRAELGRQLGHAQLAALEGGRDGRLLHGVLARLEVRERRPRHHPAVVDLPHRRLFETPVASLRAHHARHAAGRREQAHARRQRRDVAFREPLRARSPLLVEVRAAHRAHDALELGRVETCGPIAFGALLDADDEADGLPRPERHEHGAADLDRLVARFFRDGVGVRRVERLRGYVQDDGCEFHAPSISQPRAVAGTLPLHRRKSLGILFAPAVEHAIRC